MWKTDRFGIFSNILKYFLPIAIIFSNILKYFLPIAIIFRSG